MRMRTALTTNRFLDLPLPLMPIRMHTPLRTSHLTIMRPITPQFLDRPL